MAQGHPESLKKRTDLKEKRRKTIDSEITSRWNTGLTQEQIAKAIEKKYHKESDDDEVQLRDGFDSRTIEKRITELKKQGALTKQQKPKKA